MKRIFALVLLTLAVAWSMPAKSQIFMGPGSAQKAQKAGKKDQKAAEKRAKKQQKALRKYEKAQKKSTRH